MGFDYAQPTIIRVLSVVEAWYAATTIAELIVYLWFSNSRFGTRGCQTSGNNQKSMTEPTSTLKLPTSALKEWAVVIDALTTGDSMLLLRKGGIREAGGQFTVPQRQVWLYPTYEHQKPEGLKLPYRDRVTPVPSGWHPETIPIQAWAEITHVFSIQEAAVLDSLSPFHCWHSDFIIERLQWKPQHPLSVLLLRVHRLSTVRSLPYQSAYGGCKSWIEFNPPTLMDSCSSPVLSDEEYQRRSLELVEILR